jgi:hypothetical protein
MAFEGIAEYIMNNYHGKIVEIGSGNLFDVALILKNAGYDITCVDIQNTDPPGMLEFVVDDVTTPNYEIYEGSELLYSIRPPYELFPYIIALSRKIGADCLIRPLFGETPENGKLVNYRGEHFYLFNFRKV